MQIPQAIEDAMLESKQTDRGIMLWINELGHVEAGPDFPWARKNNIHLLCVVYETEVEWVRS